MGLGRGRGGVRVMSAVTFRVTVTVRVTVGGSASKACQASACSASLSRA